ncbi:MAG: 3-deoxy-7-phosphoheptulonate synthase [Deltaproteobacteria bacterium]|nr:3-deoxy-7-phosphoheptulonate synthase [Deltaproteobacteria bacterium]NIS76177.1 3-deoxy-7-phosphoheptulonate synthase [Deltaproteobacteria bacterium]
MIIVMKPKALKKELNAVISRIKGLGYKPHTIYGETRNVIGAIGDERGKFVLQSLETLPGVEKVVPILTPYKLASREFKKEKTKIRITRDVAIGGEEVIVIAGPCSIEGQKMLTDTAKFVKKTGAKILRGGAFKPRTSPYSFQGLERKGLKYLLKASREAGIPVITEVMNPEDVDLIAEHADILQVGARNIQNFGLLKKLGKTKRPVLLKRGMMTTINEFIMSAEYIISEGNGSVILCERGIRTFEDATRNTLDLSAIPVLGERTHLPVIVDPSHATGYSRYVKSMAFAAIAAGCDGLMIEVHPSPETALSDGGQSLDFSAFASLMGEIVPFVNAAGRTLAS